MELIEKIFGKNAQLTVLVSLLQNRGKATYLSGIAAEAALSHSSVARVIEPLIEIGVVKEERAGKQVRIFRLNEGNEITKLIIEFYDKLKSNKGIAHSIPAGLATNSQ